MRILLVVFIVLSVVLALYPPTFIAQLMGYSWGALPVPSSLLSSGAFTGRERQSRPYGYASSQVSA